MFHRHTPAVMCNTALECTPENCFLLNLIEGKRILLYFPVVFMLSAQYHYHWLVCIKGRWSLPLQFALFK